MTAAGDTWRGEFARICGRIIKGRNETAENLDTAADALLDCARQEEAIFQFLLDSANPQPHFTPEGGRYLQPPLTDARSRGPRPELPVSDA